MPKFNIFHITHYAYPSAVTDSANQIILYPQSLESQEITSSKITLNPKANIDVFTDYFGNKVGTFTIIEPHQFLEIKAEIEVETLPVELPLLDISAQEQWSIIEKIGKEFPYIDFLEVERSNARKEMEEIAQGIAQKGLSIMETTTEISSYIYEHFKYKQGVTTIETAIDEVWEIKAGVCQDFAHLLIGMLRMLGVPARYVSGYISPRSTELRGEGATHAWVEVFIPTYGWLGNDPTNNCWVSDRHIIIAYGRDFKDCTPVKGTYKGNSAHTLSVSVIITNDSIKEKNTEIKTPVYISEVKHEEPEFKNNSYRDFLEMQQQQQQQ